MTPHQSAVSYLTSQVDITKDTCGSVMLSAEQARSILAALSASAKNEERLRVAYKDHRDNSEFSLLMSYESWIEDIDAAIKEAK